VCGDREREPCGVGHESSGGQVRQSGGLQLGNRLLDHGVAAVIGLDLQ
jgi:hypothetical protein